MSKAADAFRTISEVADDLEVPKHVLRFWENRFPQIKPPRRLRRALLDNVRRGAPAVAGTGEQNMVCACWKQAHINSVLLNAVYINDFFLLYYHTDAIENLQLQYSRRAVLER